MANITPNRTQTILSALFDRYHAEEAQSYGESPSWDAGQGILFANWNDVPNWMQSYLEEAGFKLEWSDEWYIDYDNNGKAYRTSPDCYYWESKILFVDGSVLTPDNSIEEWIEACECYAKPSYFLPSHFSEEQLEEVGFTKFSGEDFESGWHPGQTDNPETVVKVIHQKYPDVPCVFRRSEQSQFYTKWQAWFREEVVQMPEVEIEGFDPTREPQGEPWQPDALPALEKTLKIWKWLEEARALGQKVVKGNAYRALNLEDDRNQCPCCEYGMDNRVSEDDDMCLACPMWDCTGSKPNYRCEVDPGSPYRGKGATDMVIAIKAVIKSGRKL